jgi:hypothetical protein
VTDRATLRRRGVFAAGMGLVIVAAVVGLGPHPDAGVPDDFQANRPGGQVDQPGAPDAASGSASTSGPSVVTMAAGTSNVDVRRLPQLPAAAFRNRDVLDERAAPAASLSGGTAAAPVGSGSSPAAAPAPGPSTSFDGLAYNDLCGGVQCGAGHPPDTNGDVGPTYYVETINTAIGIFDKATGTRVAAFTFDALMSQGSFGNLCDTDNYGDPVVLYDTFTDRWVITDFAFQVDSSGNIVNPPGAYQCFAISQSGDPVAGGWYFYSLHITDALNDYPKLGIWPDGIYMSANMFGFTAGGSFKNVRVWALEKSQMYAGQSAQAVSFDVGKVTGQSPFTMLPSNARAQTGTPPAGRPNLFTGLLDYNAIRVWKFHVDWANTANSTFTGPSTSLTGASWSLPPSTVPSQGGNALDTLSYRLMVQNQYTNLGGVESLWDAHTVQGSSSTQAAVRWYQVPVTGGTVGNTLQASTYNPDSANRFMPSVDVNRNGDMAIGYSVSSASLYPAIRYAGRLAGDAASTITLSETSLIEGTGTQVGNCGASACERWGDYSAMTLDPDGCTFWYTSEYYATSGLNHHTRIGSFRYPGCTDAPPYTPPPTATPGPTPSHTPTPTASPTAAPTPTPTVAPTPSPTVAPTPTPTPVITAPPDLTPPSVTTPGLSPNPAIPGAAVTVTSTASDNVGVTSAQVQLNGGAWVAMVAVDGTFGGASEAVSGTVTAPPSAGPYSVCVRASDGSGNTSNGLTCSTLTVMSFSLAPATASASAAQGKSATWTIDVSRSNFGSTIDLSASGLPAGTSASFNPDPAGGSSSVLTITTSNCGTPTPRGTFSITVSGTGAGLTRSTSVSLTVTNGTPTVTAPNPSLYANTTLSTSTVRVKNGWSACDADGISSFKLQRQVNGGSWSTVSLSSALATSINQSLTKGTTYRYRVRATDKSGLSSFYAYGPSFKPIVTDQTSSVVSYSGTWKTGSPSSCYGGSVKYSYASGAAATYSFSGSSGAWVAYKGPTRGSAQVWVDGVLMATVNLYSTTTKARPVVYVFNWSGNGSHTIRIVNLATSGHGRIDIDAFYRLLRV